jgi:hypothetical protein
LDFRFAALADVVEARGPEKLNMDYWITDVTTSTDQPGTWCKSPACIAGTAVLLGWDLEIVPIRVVDEFLLSELSLAAMDFTADWLALTREQARRLFLPEHWPANVQHWLADQYVDDGSIDWYNAQRYATWQAAVAFLRASANGRDFMDASVDDCRAVG